MPRWFVALYSVLWIGALPVALLRLLLRSVRQPAYRRGLSERLALVAPPRVCIWVHAVSVGEARAIAPLVRKLVSRGHSVLATCTTPTGRATLEALLGERVAVRYLPFDAPWLIGAWLRRLPARLVLLVETELWPGLLHAAQAEARTLWLINARLSARSARRYARFGAVSRRLFGCLSAAAAQSQADAARLLALGTRRVEVTGNLKFDLEVPPETGARAAALAEHLCGGQPRPFWVAASTREGEEALLLEALAEHPLRGRALAVLVPRHPERFGDVEALARARGFRVARRSAKSIPPNVEVVIGDSMGEMLSYVGKAVAVLMGGTLAGTGGQNLIEPCALGVPVVLGPSTYNFAQAAAEAIEVGAARAVPDARAALSAIAGWLDEPNAREVASAAARRWTQAHRGATARVLALLESELGADPGAS
ncbi:MAG: 3-deoxy-D-manno-octulosonic acid transferase [Casimicrobiaceae bacterium]|nr:3-deoxy-D-manno-octulosonic acid transferase [Casimicrobiaceae bacterium]MCX8098304.1 3-deoxy-D-manno-octulosonic acid transferase [Casimicrobiaceae bacterium]MDW8311760.1 3-deoxy-D-manno-octulosonic acid transferase [Burkholderiales bacterium]